MDIFTFYMPAAIQIYKVLWKLLFLMQYYLETMAKTAKTEVCHIQTNQVKKTTLLNTYGRQRLGDKIYYPTLTM